MQTRDFAARIGAAAAGLACLVQTVPQPAHADVRRMFEAGVWGLYTGTADSGRAVCDMRVTDDANAKKIDVIYFDNDDHLTVRMNKTSWQIPARTRVEMVLQFDAYPVWTATADGAGGDVEFTVPTSDLPNFSRQFRYGSRMRISFPSGSEAPWIASLTGTSFMLDRFLECVQRIHGTPSQPYAAPAVPLTPPPETRPTQPFAGNGQPHEDADRPAFGGGRPEPYRGSQPQPTPVAPAPTPAPRAAPVQPSPVQPAPAQPRPNAEPPPANDNRI